MSTSSQDTGGVLTTQPTTLLSKTPVGFLTYLTTIYLVYTEASQIGWIHSLSLKTSAKYSFQCLENLFFFLVLTHSDICFYREHGVLSGTSSPSANNAEDQRMSPFAVARRSLRPLLAEKESNKYESKNKYPLVLSKTCQNKKRLKQRRTVVWLLICLVGKKKFHWAHG